MEFRSFEDLEVWKKGRELRLFVKDVIKKFPSDEKYALTIQIRKSSRSITNNIQKDTVDFSIRKISNFAE